MKTKLFTVLSAFTLFFTLSSLAWADCEPVAKYDPFCSQNLDCSYPTYCVMMVNIKEEMHEKIKKPVQDIKLRINHLNNNLGNIADPTNANSVHGKLNKMSTRFTDKTNPKSIFTLINGILTSTGKNINTQMSSLDTAIQNLSAKLPQTVDCGLDLNDMRSSINGVFPDNPLMKDIRQVAKQARDKQTAQNICIEW